MLAQSIEQLPPRQKEIFLLNKQDGLSIDEIAQRLDLSRRTVENHLFRAKVFLKEALSGNGLLPVLFFWLFVR